MVFHCFWQVNNKERTAVRFRIEHYFKEIDRRLEKEELYWESPAGEVFPEDKPVLDDLRKKYDELAKPKVRERLARLEAKRAAELMLGK